MDLTLVYGLAGLGLLGLIFQRSKALAYIIFFFTWTLMWSKYTADYGSYQYIYYSPTEFRDGGYGLICMLGRMMGLSFFEFFMSLGFIAIGLYCRFTLRYSRNPALVAALYMVFISIFDLVQFRSFLAFAVVLTFIPRLFNPTRNNLIIYCIGVMLGMTIHITMIFYLSFAVMNTKWFTSKNLPRLIIPAILMGVAMYMGYEYFSTRASSLMEIYNKSVSRTTIMMLVVMLLVNIGFIYYWDKRPVATPLNSREKLIATSPGHIVLMFNIALLALLPLAVQSMTVMRLYKYVGIINFVFISNKMASYTNWRIVPQTFVVSIYGLSYLALFIFIHLNLFIRLVAKPIFTTNLFWPPLLEMF